MTTERVSRVTVMMPCYNNAAFIEEAVESVLGQSDLPPHVELELLIVDDGSRDDSVALIESMNDGRIRLVQNEHNRGISRVRNQLLQLASGDLVSSLDGDDFYFDERKLSREWKILEASRNPDRTIVYSDIRWVDEQGAEMLDASSLAPPMEGILFQGLLDRRVMVPRDFLMSTQLARSVGGFDESLPIYEDWDYKLRLAQKAFFQFTHYTGIGYRRHGMGLSSVKSSLHRRCLTKIRRKHGLSGFDGDAMQILDHTGRVQSILAGNRLRQRTKAA
ncbi:MAG: glycosyltransferase [Planctomycetota bacterium]